MGVSQTTFGVLSLTSIILIFGTLRCYIHRLSLPPSISSTAPSNNMQPWSWYAACAKASGPILRLSSLGRTIFVINSWDAASDLLDKRTSFACKPRWPMAELLGRQTNIGFMYYGAPWRDARRVLSTSLDSGSVTGIWSDLMDAESARLIQRLLQAPESFYTLTERAVQSLVFKLAYGRDVSHDYVRMSRTVMDQTNIALQGSWIVNAIPALMYIPSWTPGAGFKRWAKQAKQLFLEMTVGPVYDVKKAMAAGTAPRSLVQHAFVLGHDEASIISASGSLFGAGSDTISATILTFILLMARDAKAQLRAFEEIVTVVGENQLPSLHERRYLPFIDSLIQEVYRYHPAVPLVTHSNVSNEEYLQCRIPKKTWIMANVWAMARDESIYLNPEDFIPDRFLASDSNPRQPDPRRFIFGFGRRRCPGAQFADSFIYLVVTRMLLAFEIKPSLASDMLDDRPRFKTTLISAPTPFSCQLVPRENVAKLFES